MIYNSGVSDPSLHCLEICFCPSIPTYLLAVCVVCLLAINVLLCYMMHARYYICNSYTKEQTSSIMTYMR